MLFPALNALFELFVLGPCFRSVTDNRINAGVQEFDFEILRNSGGPNCLIFYERSPSQAFVDVKILSAICNIASDSSEVFKAMHMLEEIFIIRVFAMIEVSSKSMITVTNPVLGTFMKSLSSHLFYSNFNINWEALSILYRIG